LLFCLFPRWRIGGGRSARGQSWPRDQAPNARGYVRQRPRSFQTARLQLRHADGDIVEIFGTRGSSHRYLLPSLRVEVQPSSKGELVMRSAWAPADWPLYELFAKPRYQRGEVEAFIPVAEEPIYRQFFTQVAQLCGRSVAA
jgi:hypothetical protein